MAAVAHEIRLARRPGREVGPDDFAIATVTLPELAENQVLVRNQWFSLDPYMRLPLTGREGVHAAMKVGEAMAGAAVGVVTASRAPGLPEGTLVVSQKGWRDAFVAPAEQLQPVDPSLGPAHWRLGVLGLTGITAYVGVEFVLAPHPGESVYVSGAAGAVGMVACQLAKRRGCRVLGSAGSDDKVAWLEREIGVDAAVNYRTADLEDFLRRSAPGGVDAYFDNVGGGTLDAVLRAMKIQGRIALCGAIAQYNDDNYRVGPSDFFTIIEKGLTLVGFNAGLAGPRGPEIIPALAALLRSGELKWQETVVDGLEATPGAFASLFTGANLGKMLVRLPD